jgi:hypothetical protein
VARTVQTGPPAPLIPPRTSREAWNPPISYSDNVCRRSGMLDALRSLDFHTHLRFGSELRCLGFGIELREEQSGQFAQIALLTRYSRGTRGRSGWKTSVSLPPSDIRLCMENGCAPQSGRRCSCMATLTFSPNKNSNDRRKSGLHFTNGACCTWLLLRRLLLLWLPAASKRAVKLD